MQRSRGWRRNRATPLRSPLPASAVAAWRNTRSSATSILSDSADARGVDRAVHDVPEVPVELERERGVGARHRAIHGPGAHVDETKERLSEPEVARARPPDAR